MAELRQDAEIEVRQVLLDLTTATARLAAAERRVTATRAALDVEQTRYESGANTLVELSQARARMIESEAQVIEARNILTLRSQTLAFALGVITPVRVPAEMPGE
jgi:outer membrane protein